MIFFQKNYKKQMMKISGKTYCYIRKIIAYFVFNMPGAVIYNDTSLIWLLIDWRHGRQ